MQIEKLHSCKIACNNWNLRWFTIGSYIRCPGSIQFVNLNVKHRLFIRCIDYIESFSPHIAQDISSYRIVALGRSRVLFAFPERTLALTFLFSGKKRLAPLTGRSVKIEQDKTFYPEPITNLRLEKGQQFATYFYRLNVWLNCLFIFWTSLWSR